MREGVRALSDDLRGGPKDLIASAIMELIGATDRPPQLDEEKAAARILALRNMAWDYPIDVVQAACRRWRKVPQHGRWWPTEQDLRAQCEPLFTSRRKLHAQAVELLRHLEAEEDLARRQAAPSPFAGDKARRFQAEMRKRLGEERYSCYFDAAEIAYDGDVVYVRTQVADCVLDREGGDVLRALGLRVEYAPAQFSDIRQSRRDDTPAQSAAVGAKLKRLFEAMSKGENLRELRSRGEI